MTGDKEAALRLSNIDLTVEQIKEVIAKRPDQVIYEAHELLGIEKGKFIANQYKHKLRAAGLVPIGQHRYKGARPSLWVHESTTEDSWRHELHEHVELDDL